MSTKKKACDGFYVEPLDEHTNASIHRAILDSGDPVLEERQIFLKINEKPKDVIFVSKEFLGKMEKSKNQILGGPLLYNIYIRSKNGRYLNLPRESFKKKDNKIAKEKITVKALAKFKKRLKAKQNLK